MMTVAEIHPNVMEAVAARDMLRSLGFTPDELFIAYNDLPHPHVSIEVYPGLTEAGARDLRVRGRQSQLPAFKWEVAELEPDTYEFNRQWCAIADELNSKDPVWAASFADALTKRKHQTEAWAGQVGLVTRLIDKGLYPRPGTAASAHVGRDA